MSHCEPAALKTQHSSFRLAQRHCSMQVNHLCRTSLALHSRESDRSKAGADHPIRPPTPRPHPSPPAQAPDQPSPNPIHLWCRPEMRRLTNKLRGFNYPCNPQSGSRRHSGPTFTGVGSARESEREREGEREIPPEAIGTEFSGAKSLLITAQPTKLTKYGG